MNEAPTPEQNILDMNRVVDAIEFMMNAGPAIEWPTWKSTEDLTIPELVDKCFRSLKARLQHNVDATDWTSTGGPPANPMRGVTGMINDHRKEFEDKARQIGEQESLAPTALASRMLDLVRQVLVTVILSAEMRESMPERSWPLFSDICHERGYPVEINV